MVRERENQRWESGLDPRWSAGAADCGSTSGEGIAGADGDVAELLTLQAARVLQSSRSTRAMRGPRVCALRCIVDLLENLSVLGAGRFGQQGGFYRPGCAPSGATTHHQLRSGPYQQKVPLLQTFLFCTRQ